jgi:membrane-bound lytic murein transglycosylase B
MLIPLLLSLTLAATTTAPAASSSTPILSDMDRAARIEYVAKQLRAKGVSEARIQRIFSDKRLKIYPRPQVSGTPIDWEAFEAGLLKRSSVTDGKKFLTAYRTSLANAEKKYGVDRTAIVAIIRIETSFGKWMGSHNAMSVFYSNLLNPEATEKKWQWAGDNLSALVLHARNLDYDPLLIKSSWAGAIGAPQFLPVSIIAWGKDGSGDGYVNLHDMRDAISSAASFLVAHGWKEDRVKALASYYGSAIGYPAAAEKYSAALKR